MQERLRDLGLGWKPRAKIVSKLIVDSWNEKMVDELRALIESGCEGIERLRELNVVALSLIAPGLGKWLCWGGSSSRERRVNNAGGLGLTWKGWSRRFSWQCLRFLE